jgi:Ca2+-binding RTX toxin-like protein
LADDDTGASIAETIAAVSGVALTAEGELLIYGTNDRDIFDITERKISHVDHIRVEAKFHKSSDPLNVVYDFPASQVESITVQLGGGDDDLSSEKKIAIDFFVDGGQGNDDIRTAAGNDTIIDLAGNNDIRSEDGNDRITTGAGHDSIRGGKGSDLVRAGAGDDTLEGEEGNDILLGEEGADRLNGDQARDLLIGGIGADRLVGNGDGDLFIAGTTTFDANDAALAAIMAEWSSSRSYSQRIHNLSNGTAAAGLDSSQFAARANAGFFLIGNAGAGQTVFSDTDVDTLTGSQGTDWFLANRLADNGGPLDIVNSQSGEISTDIDL